MQFQFHVEVRQVDVAKAREESPRGDRAYAHEVIYQAILRAIGHCVHAPIRVALDGIAIEIPGCEGETPYPYGENLITQHMMKWGKIQACRPPWLVERPAEPPQMPDFNFDIPLDEIAWKALGLREPCVSQATPMYERERAL